MKKSISLIVITISTIIIMTSCPLINNLLQGSIGGDGGGPDLFYGMVEVNLAGDENDNIYLASWEKGKIVDLKNKSYIISICATPHGLATIDGENFWVSDLNQEKITKYNVSSITTSSHSFEGDSQPVNILIADDKMFVADRNKDKIIQFDYVSSTDTIDINTSVEYDLTEFLDLNLAVGYIDMVYDSTKLYIASDEFKGYIIIDFALDDTDENFITAVSLDDLDAGVMGIAIENDSIYLNTGNKLYLKIDDDLYLLDENMSATSTYDYSRDYVDLVLTDKGYGDNITANSSKYLYVAEGINSDVAEGYVHHVIRYDYVVDTELDEWDRWQFGAVIDDFSF